MSTLDRAIGIANIAHAGQVDKAGQPYILHPIRVMLAMPTEVGRIVGVLHDVVEDSQRWSFDMIAARGFGPEVIEPLRLLTRRRDVPYDAYIDAIVQAENAVARDVKMQDLLDNLRKERLRCLPLATRVRLEGRYVGALALLGKGEMSATGTR